MSQFLHSTCDEIDYPINENFAKCFTHNTWNYNCCLYFTLKKITLKQKTDTNIADEFDNNFLIINAEEDLELNLKRICTWLKVDNSK